MENSTLYKAAAMAGGMALLGAGYSCEKKFERDEMAAIEKAKDWEGREANIRAKEAEIVQKHRPDDRKFMNVVQDCRSAVDSCIDAKPIPEVCRGRLLVAPSYFTHSMAPHSGETHSFFTGNLGSIRCYADLQPTVFHCLEQEFQCVQEADRK